MNKKSPPTLKLFMPSLLFQFICMFVTCFDKEKFAVIPAPKGSDFVPGEFLSAAVALVFRLLHFDELSELSDVVIERVHLLKTSLRTRSAVGAACGGYKEIPRDGHMIANLIKKSLFPGVPVLTSLPLV